MFSLDNFYHILHYNLLDNKSIQPFYFYPFGSTAQENLVILGNAEQLMPRLPRMTILFHDQEPLSLSLNWREDYKLCPPLIVKSNKLVKVLANSEHSEFKNQLCKDENLADWYYFYHGFAALDWYRDYQYIKDVPASKKFLCLNRITTGDRSYRLTLVANLLNRGLIDQGLVSLNIDDIGEGTWQEEITDPDSQLTDASKSLIKNHIGVLPHSLVVDRYKPDADCSAHVGPAEIALNQSAFWHVVTETVFYHNKQHLTEKVFKPIVSKRPFVLVAAPNNLAYLKSYGFKTFDQWIDESYDAETDHDLRINMISDQIEKICSMSEAELTQLHAKMQSVLDYNYNHFFTNFKTHIVCELVDNFQNVVDIWNAGCEIGRNVDLSTVNFEHVKQLLCG